MKLFVKHAVRLIRKSVTEPLQIAVSIFWYVLVETTFGSSAAHNYLSRLNGPCIVPIIKLRGGNIGEGTVIQSGVVFHNCSNFKNLKIGNNCHIGKEAFFDLRGDIEIGDNVVIAMRCSFITHLDLGSSALSSIYPAKYSSIEVNSHSYLGCGVTLLMGSKVGESTIVGANSLVNGKLLSNHLYAGTPAKKIKDLRGN